MSEAERLREIQERAEKATEGPWEIDHHEIEVGGGTEYDQTIVCSPAKYICGSRKYDDYDVSEVEDADEDMSFIANARADIPFLLELIKRLKGEAHE